MLGGLIGSGAENAGGRVGGGGSRLVSIGREKDGVIHLRMIIFHIARFRFGAD